MGVADVSTLLEISDLQVSYRTGAGWVAGTAGVDLSVGIGEIVALVGESGSGKSTTAHAAVGLLPATARISAGRIVFDGQDLAHASERTLRTIRGTGIGFVPQDPGVSLNPTTRVGDQVAEVLRIHRLASRSQAAAQAVELLADAGLPEADVRARQYPHELSGGMRQRVLIAIARAARPRLLIADEPTSALDVTVQRQILDQLESERDERGTAILLITHDLGVATDRADRVVVMSQGRVVEAGTPDDLLTAARHPYTRKLLAAVPTAGPARAAVPHENPLITVENLAKDFALPGGTVVRAVDDVSFSIGRGETFGLVGESGSGKSTTARMILRLATPTAGRILLDGNEITAASGAGLRALRRRVQPVFQNPYASLDPRFTVSDIVVEPLRAYKVGDRASRRARAAELIDRVALPADTLRRKPTELSGGQRQRVAIARALALSPDLVVCDEPVSALDVSVQAQVLDLLAELQQQLGVSYLFISHDLAVVRRIAHRVGVMKSGSLVETGTPEQIFTAPEHDYTRRLLAAIPGRRAFSGKDRG
jgi:peptide/nickel transport system ATP-binding protein